MRQVNWEDFNTEGTIRNAFNAFAANANATIKFDYGNAYVTPEDPEDRYKDNAILFRLERKK